MYASSWLQHTSACLQMVSHMLLNALIAAACCAVTAFVVLPSLAGDEVYSNVAAALRHTGHSLSG